jgi:WD40 repeat protein
LAETANRLRQTDPSAAGQFAVLAWKTAQTPQARSALLDTSATPLARRVDGPGGPATVAVSGNARVMAAVGSQEGLRIWTLSGQPDPIPTEVSTLPEADNVALTTVALNREGTVLVAAGDSGVLHAWDLSKPNKPAPLPSPSVSKTVILKLTFSVDGHTLAVCLRNGKVLLYDVRPGKGPSTLTALGPPISGAAADGAAAAFSSDSRVLAVANGSKAQLWLLTNRAHPQRVPVLFTGPTAAITSLVFSPDGRQLVASSKDQKTYSWLLATPTVAPIQYEDSPNEVDTLAFSPDNTYLASGGTDHHLRIYEAATHTIVADLPHPGPVTAATYLSDGRTLVTGSADGAVRLWPVPGPTASTPTARTMHLAYLDHGRLAAMTSKNSVKVFNVSQDYRPHPQGIVPGPAAAGTSRSSSFSGTMAVDGSGTLLAAGGTDGSVWLYKVSNSAKTGQPVQHVATCPHSQKGPIESVTISPEGKTLATGSADGTIQLTDISNPQAPRSLGTPLTSSGVAYALAFSPNGSKLAVGTGNPNAVLLFDVHDRATPQRIGNPISGPALPIYSIAFSPDGRTLAVGSADRSVRLLDTTKPARSRWHGGPLLGSDNDASDVAFSPDGRVIAAASGDEAVRLWDVSDRDQPAALASLTTPSGQALNAVAFDRSSGRLAASGAAQTVWQWDLDTEATGKRVLRSRWGASRQGGHYLPSIPYGPACRG